MEFSIKTNRSTLCQTCQRATVVKFKDWSTAIRCARLEKFIEKDVDECSDYSATGSKDEWDMEKIAWIIDVNKSGKAIGFCQPGTDKHRELRRDF